MIKLFALLSVVIASLNCVSADRVPITLGYYPSWSDNWVAENNAAGSNLAKLPSSISHIFLAFAKPDLRYTKGSYDISNTGIQFSYDGRTAKQVIQTLKNKGIQVLLSIGGETYWGGGVPAINYQQIADLVKDFGFIGVDWDFEPNGSFAEIGSAVNVQHFITFINETRKVLPKSEGYLIAVAPAGCGALGGLNNDDTTSPFKYANRNNLTGQADTLLNDFTKNISLFGFASTGHMIPVFNQVGDQIDIVAYQGYNMGGAPNRYLAYQSFAHYANKHGFVVAAGVHVPNEPWGPYFVSNAMKTAEFMKQIMDTDDRRGKGDGMMVWQILTTSAYPGESLHSGKSYLNIARNVFNGQSPSDAVTNAFNYPTSGSSTNNVVTTAPAVSTAAPVSNNTGVSPDPSVSSTSAPISSTASSVVNTQINSNSSPLAPWDSTVIYAVPGIRVTYDNRTYENKWYTLNEVPDISDVWRDVSPVDPNVIPIWNRLKTYDTAGMKVSHNNQTYSNKWWTKGEEPGLNEVWQLAP